VMKKRSNGVLEYRDAGTPRARPSSLHHSITPLLQLFTTPSLQLFPSLRLFP
jgi:hypothetical protein